MADDEVVLLDREGLHLSLQGGEAWLSLHVWSEHADAILSVEDIDALIAALMRAKSGIQP